MPCAERKTIKRPSGLQVAAMFALGPVVKRVGMFRCKSCTHISAVEPALTVVARRLPYPRARRLDFALVGARRLVLVEADPELLDPVARDGDARHALPARHDAHRRRRRAAAHPEWVVRTPNVLIDDRRDVPASTRASRRSSGAAPACSARIVLATMPDWYFLAHQTMTDMPFVAAMTAAMGLLLIGLQHRRRRSASHVYEVDGFGSKRSPLAAGTSSSASMLLCALPQILYLLSRNIELVLHGDGPKGFRFHWDEFRSGSAGNCGLPGNEACIADHAGEHPEGGWRRTRTASASRCSASSAASSRRSRASSGACVARRRCST